MVTKMALTSAVALILTVGWAWAQHAGAGGTGMSGCGMNMSGCSMGSGCGMATTSPAATKPATQPATQQASVYTCPMHPAVTRDKPAQCPTCGMDLVLKKGKAQPSQSQKPDSGGHDGHNHGE